MNARYGQGALQRTATLIHKRFHTSTERSKELAAQALDGIDAHGLDPDDWQTVVATVNVVVRAWISSDVGK
jgi:hypothetical protein